jgi:hypothetical protein
MASPFELRPWPYILGGYLAAPIVGTAVAWLYVVASAALRLSTGVPDSGLIRIGMDLIGLFFGFAIELIVVTPLLIGFHRWRWRWLNGWTGAGLGFLTISGPIFAFAVLSGVPQRIAAQHGPHALSNGSQTVIAWISTIIASLALGPVGAASAWVLRLIIVRDASVAPSVASEFD